MTKELLLSSKEIKQYRDLGINTKSNDFKRFYKAGLLKSIDQSLAVEVQNYWGKLYNKEIDPVLHMAFYNLTGKKEPRLVPSREMWNEFIPYFNDMNIRVGYSDKNIYDKLIGTKNTAEIVLKCVRGNYFDKDNIQLNQQDVYQLLLHVQDDLIIKPSDSDNGQGVAKIVHDQNQLYFEENKMTIQKLEETYGFNFTVQKVIK